MSPEFVMARRGVLGMLGGAMATAVGGCGLLNTTYTYRYRMTVEVDTPEGLKTGSSVQEQTATKYAFPGYFGGAERDLTTRGEAVAVDLPGGQTLFALLPDSSLTQSVLDPDWKNDWAESAKRISGGDTPQGPRAMTPGKPKGRFDKLIGYPMLVRFRYIADPTSVEKVDPANLAVRFGPGVRLRRITVELTDDDVTTGIEKRLGWLPNYFDKMLDGSSINNSRELANSLSQVDFELR